MNVSKIVKSKNKAEKVKAFKKLRFKNVLLLTYAYVGIITIGANTVLTGVGFQPPFLAGLINVSLACLVGLVAEENNRVRFKMTLLARSGL